MKITRIRRRGLGGSLRGEKCGECKSELTPSRVVAGGHSGKILRLSFIKRGIRANWQLEITRLVESSGREFCIGYADIELALEAVPVAAILLPPDEQLEDFEKDLEAHDGGNQPA